MIGDRQREVRSCNLRNKHFVPCMPAGTDEWCELFRLEGILSSRRTHPLTHMVTKAAALASTESGESTKSAYAEYVNPQWVSLLERCEGAELYTKDGRTILDFLSGYCVHNAGHNHPHIVRELQDGALRNSEGGAWSRTPLRHRIYGSSPPCFAGLL